MNSTYVKIPAKQSALLREFRATHPYTDLEVDGAPWRYLACGQGERALLFLPGGFLAADMWFYQILHFESAYRIIAPDSFPLQGIFSMDGICKALVQSLDSEGIEKATVVGLSAGGGVAQYLLQAYPERIEDIVFSHCGILESNPQTEKLLGRLLRLAKLLPLWAIKRIMLKRTSGEIPSTSAWIDFHNAYFQEASQRFTKEMFLNFLQSGLETRRHARFDSDVLESWPGRILILGSKDDEVAIGNLEKLQARYPQAQTHLLEEGGHHAFILFPEAYTAALAAFLEK